METISKKEFKELSDKINCFLDQYDLDMRGDMNASNGGKRGMVDNVREIRHIQNTYPSITFLFAHKPIPTIIITIGIFLVLYGMLALGIFTMISPLLGIDVSTIAPNAH